MVIFAQIFLNQALKGAIFFNFNFSDKQFLKRPKGNTALFHSHTHTASTLSPYRGKSVTLKFVGKKFSINFSHSIIFQSFNFACADWLHTFVRHSENIFWKKNFFFYLFVCKLQKTGILGLKLLQTRKRQVVNFWRPNIIFKFKSL